MCCLLQMVAKGYDFPGWLLSKVSAFLLSLEMVAVKDDCFGGAVSVCVYVFLSPSAFVFISVSASVCVYVSVSIYYIYIYIYMCICVSGYNVITHTKSSPMKDTTYIRMQNSPQ